MFWKVNGYDKPSPIEQILDKEEFTLEELLDEDDIIQECKSLNSRLLAFLKERSTVEQLLRYLVEPPPNSDDVKRCYKYPFTACEVFCCEIDALFKVIYSDPELMKLLFSLLDSPPPLNSKVAGYFGRVVGLLLQRNTNEVMPYFQANPSILDKLMNHVDTASITDIIKKLAGADDTTSLILFPMYSKWLSDAGLIKSLLARLDAKFSLEIQSNAADILTEIAHTLPTPLASRLCSAECMDELFQSALYSSKQVLVPAVNVCIALLEPRRTLQDERAREGSAQHDDYLCMRQDAIAAIVKHMPSLVEHLRSGQPDASLETSYGMLCPPLGSGRLKIVELVSVLLRTGVPAAEVIVEDTKALVLCMQLFEMYPFNNLLHHRIKNMMKAGLSRPGDRLFMHLIDDCHLVEWLIDLPEEITPTPRPGTEDLARSKPPLRAGYLGHVTQIASTLEDTLNSVLKGKQGGENVETVQKAAEISTHEGWQKYLQGTLHVRMVLENVREWACGRPPDNELAGIESDGDEYQFFQNEIDPEQLQGLQPLYHRYSVVDENDEEEEDPHDGMHGFPSMEINPNTITQSMEGMQLGVGLADEAFAEEDPKMGGARHMNQAMEDDRVLFTTSDEDDIVLEGSGAGAADVQMSPPPPTYEEAVPAAAAAQAEFAAAEEPLRAEGAEATGTEGAEATGTEGADATGTEGAEAIGTDGEGSS